MDLTIMDLTIMERVTNGMAYLDATYPDHVDQVDIDRLNVGSSYECPLGQANGQSYEDGLVKAMNDLSIGEDNERQWSQDHGFCWVNGLGFTADIDALTDEWKHQYRARHNAEWIEAAERSASE